jgi:Gpi18-like mannosyltransferase
VKVFSKISKIKVLFSKPFYCWIKALQKTDKVKMTIAKSISKNTFIFPITIWLSSRLLIWVAMLIIAPLLPAPPNGIAASFGWGVFDGWDTIHFRAIATSGYHYVDGKGDIVFFPLYPLLIHGLVSLGLSFEVAGVLISNFAFVGTVCLLYTWVRDNHSDDTARWTVAIACLFPTSVFVTSIYTEGLYLLLSTATLQAFDQKRYALTSFCGALATATRPTGIALIPALILAAWKQRRPPIAYLAGLATATGLILFSLYCTIQFSDPLAFVHAQKAWRPTFGFDWSSWWKMLMQICIGTPNWKYGGIREPLHPLIFSVIAICTGLLWYFRNRVTPAQRDYGFGILFLALWLLAGDPFLNTLVVVGGVYLLWHYRQQLTPVTLFYGLAGMGILIFSGKAWSLTRLVFGIISPIIAFGILLSRHPRWGYMSLGFCGLLLVIFAIRFAQDLWVG